MNKKIKPFQFKEFTIEHDKCAMKVGFDGALLAVWGKHNNPLEILDIGSGSGMISLILRQRFKHANILALEILVPVEYEGTLDATTLYFSSASGGLSFGGTNFLNSLKLDDVVGAIPVHMFAGIWGTLVVPLTNPDASYLIQLLGVTSVCIFVFVFSYIVIYLIKNIMGLRISEEAEKLGTDKAEVGVVAYSIRD